MAQRSITETERQNVRAIARQLALPWYLLFAVAALATWLAWQAFGPSRHGDPLATSLGAFEKANRLTVFSAQLSPVVSADDVRIFGMLKARQIAVIPARVDYTVDFSRIDAGRIQWDGAAKRLTVTLPPIELSPPNLDEARAQYLREGVWIGREAQAKLTRDNTLLAQRQAAEQARNPALLGLARNAAKDAVRQNLEIPLRAAGYKDVTVAVGFDGEPALPAQ
jgi:Protein of unknown function (DUF4230)